MSFERPWFLAALVSLPVLWLLSRRAWQRREAAVSSLFIWRRLSLPPAPPRETRRRWEWLLALRLAAAGLVALAAAGPGKPAGVGGSRLDVVVDDSPPMSAFAGEVARALHRVRAAAPEGAVVDVRRSPGLRDVPSILANGGKGSVVVVTDHPIGVSSSGRVRLLLVGRPVENVGIVSAWIEPDGGRFHAVVQNFTNRAKTVGVVSTTGRRTLSLAPGEKELVSGPARGDRATIRLVPGDAFSFDDRVEVGLVPARHVDLRWTGPDEPRLRLALELAGIRFSKSARGDVSYRRPPSSQSRLRVAPPGAALPVDAGSLAGGGGLPSGAVPGPDVHLGSAVRLSGRGGVFLSDDRGTLALEESGRVTVALDPGAPDSQWSSDPSFPIFWAEVARRLGVEPARSEVLSGTIDPAESASKPQGNEWNLAGLEASATGGGTPPVSFSAPLFAAAALLVLVHVLVESERMRRQLWVAKAEGNTEV